MSKISILLYLCPVSWRRQPMSGQNNQFTTHVDDIKTGDWKHGGRKEFEDGGQLGGGRVWDD